MRTSLLADIDQYRKTQIFEICNAGYPTVQYYEPEGSARFGHFDWWTDDECETELMAKYEAALDRGDESVR